MNVSCIHCSTFMRRIRDISGILRWRVGAGELSAIRSLKPVPMYAGQAVLLTEQLKFLRSRTPVSVLQKALISSQQLTLAHRCIWKDSTNLSKVLGKFLNQAQREPKYHRTKIEQGEPIGCSPLGLEGPNTRFVKYCGPIFLELPMKDLCSIILQYIICLKNPVKLIE